MYVSIDVETTGLDTENFQVLQLGAVAWTSDDINQCRTFDMILDPTRGPTRGNYGQPLVGDPYGLLMNAWLLEEIVNGRGALYTTVMSEFSKFLHQFRVQHDDIQGGKYIWAVGQNFGKFDWQFLKNIPGFPVKLFGHRFTEVGTFMADRDGPHSGTEDFARIAEKYSIGGETHHALYDAKCTLAKLMETLDVRP